MAALERNKKIAAAAGLGVFQRLVQLASTLVVMPILLHALGPAGFGTWGAAASLPWFSGLADLGTGSALVTLGEVPCEKLSLFARKSPIDIASNHRGRFIIDPLSDTSISMSSDVWASALSIARANSSARFSVGIANDQSRGHFIHGLRTTCPATSIITFGISKSG